MATPDLNVELSRLRIDKNQKRPPRRHLGRFIFAVVVLAALAGGYYWTTHRSAVVAVKVAPAEKEEGSAEGIAVLTAGGYVIPREKIEISSKIIGQVKKVYVERGDKVKAGDVILRLDDAEYVAQVRQAEAQLASASAQLARLRAGSRPQEKAAARAAVASAKATLVDAQLDLKRMEELLAQSAVSRQQLDKARAAHDVAKAAYDSTLKNAELVEIGPRKEEIDAAEAALQEASAALAYAKTQLDYTVITAPISGTILEKLAEEGELVTNINFGGTRGAKSSTVSMADLSDLQVEIDLNENDLGKVHLKQKCRIRLDSAPDTAFAGEVEEIAPEADRQKATVQVKVKLIDPADFVRPEVNARVTFLVEHPGGRREGPLVWAPRAAVAESEDGPVVFVASGEIAVARKVRTGIEGERGLEIVAGLAGGESLIVEPLDKVSDGARIRVEEP